MRTSFTKSFKLHAVEKALSRNKKQSVREVAESLEVGFSTLQGWIRKSKNMTLASEETMSKEKRPQDWSLEDRLEMVIACGPLDEEAISERCRAEGVYPHHVKQWKLDFSAGKAQSQMGKTGVETKRLKQENKSLKKELNRKDKALAETAALLVLQKKVNSIWGIDEDDSQ